MYICLSSHVYIHMQDEPRVHTSSTYACIYVCHLMCTYTREMSQNRMQFQHMYIHIFRLMMRDEPRIHIISIYVYTHLLSHVYIHMRYEPKKKMHASSACMVCACMSGSSVYEKHVSQTYLQVWHVWSMYVSFDLCLHNHVSQICLQVWVVWSMYAFWVMCT
jgi:hypothetical protein